MPERDRRVTRESDEGDKGRAENQARIVNDAEQHARHDAAALTRSPGAPFALAAANPTLPVGWHAQHRVAATALDQAA